MQAVGDDNNIFINRTLYTNVILKLLK